MVGLFLIESVSHTSLMSKTAQVLIDHSPSNSSPRPTLQFSRHSQTHKQLVTKLISNSLTWIFDIVSPKPFEPRLVSIITRNSLSVTASNYLKTHNHYRSMMVHYLFIDFHNFLNIRSVPWSYLCNTRNLP